ncbi:MAG: SPOR domain-containing protein [Legionellales bacterium]
MKNLALKCALSSAIGICLLSLSELAVAQIVYGLENARTFNTSQHGPFTVQAGSFLSAENARQLTAQLATQVHAPMRIKHSHQYYLVLIGPLTSTAAVRSVGSTATNTHVRGAHPLQPKPTYVAQPVLPSPVNKQNMAVLLPKTSNGNWFVAAEFGILWPRVHNSMTVDNGSDYPPPANVDQYSASVKDQQPMLDIAAGYRWHRDSQLLTAYSLALRYQHVFTQNISGTITQYSLPEFNNYTYAWKTSADVLSLASKVGLARYGRFIPYVDGGIGASFNRAGRYQETALAGVTPRISPAFASKNKGQFAYNVGAGVDALLTPQFILSLGYDFQAFGSMTSGSGQSTWAGTKLELGNTNASTALIGITYLLDHNV